METSEIRRIARRIFVIQQLNMNTTTPFMVYLYILIAQVPSELVTKVLIPLPAIAILLGSVGPYVSVMRSVRHALQSVPGEPPGERLTRILKLPRVLELRVSLNYFIGALMYLSWMTFGVGLPLFLLPWAGMVVAVFIMLVMIWARIFIEKLLMPIALEEFFRQPEAYNEGKGFYWPKQRWYLPYAFALFIICTLLTMGTVVVRVAMTKYEELSAQLDATGRELLDQTVNGYLMDVRLPLMLLGLFMLVSAAFAAMMMARHQARGFQALRESIEGLATGKPTLPAWVATDELGDLSQATARAFNRMRALSLSLGETAASLGSSATQLDSSTTLQNEVITRQAASLQETQVTAEEIRQTSQMAAEKAEEMIRQADAVEKLGRESAEAIEQSIASLHEIRQQVADMASRISMLDERAQEIGSITETVKDLADQSNMLAINAAIEAARYGDQGKGFGVVAQEIRSMADQSIKATNQVRHILQDISLAIRSTADVTKLGFERVEASVEQVKAFGNNMRKLSDIMQTNTANIRQISAAVNQQNVGITQIFQAVNDLNVIMHETVTQLNQTNDVTLNVRGVASRVAALLDSYGWKGTGLPTQEPVAK
jgi:methyl-accepting chemotaxis protein